MDELNAERSGGASTGFDDAEDDGAISLWRMFLLEACGGIWAEGSLACKLVS